MVFQPERILPAQASIMLSMQERIRSLIVSSLDLVTIVSNGVRKIAWKLKLLNSGFIKNLTLSCLSESIANIPRLVLPDSPTVVKCDASVAHICDQAILDLAAILKSATSTNFCKEKTRGTAAAVVVVVVVVVVGVVR